MKSIAFTCIAVTTELAALALPIRLAAQVDGSGTANVIPRWIDRTPQQSSACLASLALLKLQKPKRYLAMNWSTNDSTRPQAARAVSVSPSETQAINRAARHVLGGGLCEFHADARRHFSNNACSSVHS